MKILFLVIIALAYYVHCEEVEERSEKYLFENDMGKESLGDENVQPVTESNNEYSSFHQGHDVGVNPNEVTFNRQGRIMTKSKARSHGNNKNFENSYQRSGVPSYDQNGHVNVIYKSYPLLIRNVPQINYESSYGMIKRKESKPFVPSPQIFDGNYGAAAFDNDESESNGYEYSHYKSSPQYTPKSTSWIESNYRNTNGFRVNGNGYGTAKELSPNVNGYKAPFANGNGYGAIKEYNPVFSGYRASTSNGYSVRKFGAPRSFDMNDYPTQKIISYASPEVKDINAPAHAQNTEYKPTLFSEYGNQLRHEELQNKAPQFKSQENQQYMYVVPQEYSSIPRQNVNAFGNGELATKTPEFNPYEKQQYTYVAPKELNSNPSENFDVSRYKGQQLGNSFQYVPNTTSDYNKAYLSTPSFQNSLRDIVKMVNEEQRKSNGKAIFLIGKPQVPQHMLGNPAQYSAPSSQQGYANNVNAFAGYKY